MRRNRLPKYVIKGNVEGSTEVMGRQGRRRKKLLDDLQEKNKTMLEIERWSTSSNSGEFALTESMEWTNE